MSTQGQNKDKNKKSSGPKSSTSGPISTIKKNNKDDGKHNQTNTNKGR